MSTRVSISSRPTNCRARGICASNSNPTPASAGFPDPIPIPIARALNRGGTATILDREVEYDQLQCKHHVNTYAHACIFTYTYTPPSRVVAPASSHPRTRATVLVAHIAVSDACTSPHAPGTRTAPRRHGAAPDRARARATRARTRRPSRPHYASSCATY